MSELPKVIEAGAVDEQTIKNYLFTSATKLTDKQQEMFLQIAIRHNLDPFKREIYAIAYGNEFSIVTGYEVYIKRADASGQLHGWKCENTDEGAKIIIWRKDWEHPFEWVATYDEFDKGQSSWKKMKKFMIKKVCIGQGFRLAFPTELGGMPYFKEEVEGQEPFGEKPEVQKTQSKSETKKTQSKKESGVTSGKAGKLPTDEIMTKIDRVAQKETKGNPKYTIYSIGDTAYHTFDEKTADEAKNIAGSDIEALILFEIHPKFGNQIVDKGFEIQEAGA